MKNSQRDPRLRSRRGLRGARAWAQKALRFVDRKPSSERSRTSRYAMVSNPSADPPHFGELLRRLRTAAGLTQEALAERAGLSARGLSDLERGVRSAPRQDTLRLLIDALVLEPVERAALVSAAQQGA